MSLQTQRRIQGLSAQPPLENARLDMLAKKFLVGDSFTVADSYLYIMLHWPAYVQVDISKYDVLNNYKERVAALDFVKEAHAEMQALEKEQSA